MNLRTSIALLSAGILSSCATVPPEPAVYACSIIMAAEPYGYCINSKDDQDKYRIPLEQMASEKYIASKSEDYVKVMAYIRQLKRAAMRQGCE